MAAAQRSPETAGFAPLLVSIKSSESAVRHALSKVLTGLAPLHLGPEEAASVELVLAEALNNIVEHAYPPHGTEGPIQILCKHRADGLHVNIKDQGFAMPDGQLPLGRAPAVDLELPDLPEGGFGWFLIRDLAKDVKYARVGEENHLHFRMAVGMRRAS